MTTVVPIAQDELRLEAATRWALKIEAGLNDRDRDALQVWLAEHATHADVLLEVTAVWDKTESLARLADLFPREARTPRAKPVLWGRRPVLAGAASLMMLVIAAVLFLPRPEPNLDSALPRPMQSAAYQTAVGEQKTVLLPDGSEVMLNTDSQLSVNFTPNARVLRLMRGEIHIVVTKDPSRPLSVVAGDRIMQAVGTSFSVEITDDQHIELMVTEGKVIVGVNTTADRADTSPRVLAQSASNTVSAGEALVLGAAEKVAPVSVDDIEVKLSWRHGRLIFRSEPLEKALAEVERYTTVEFVLLDEELKTRSVSGRYRTGDVDALLIALRLNFNIAHEYVDKQKVLLSSR